MLRLIVIVVVVTAVWLIVRARTTPSIGAELSDSNGKLSKRAAALGLLPKTHLNTELSCPPDPSLVALCQSARSGDWRPASHALALTLHHRDWHRRTRVASALGEAAAVDDTWLLAWEQEAPNDPGAALVRGDGSVTLAWQIRGGGWGSTVGQERATAFLRTAEHAQQELRRAIALAPGDPTPYSSLIWTVTALGGSHDELRAVWAELKASADPYDYHAHHAALQYWCRKWHGSEPLATGFATGAAGGAPAGTLLGMLPLISWYEHEDDDAKDDDFRHPVLIAAVDWLLTDVAAAPPTHPSLASARHLLAYFLVRQRRYEAALEQFRLVDGYVDAAPWRYFGDPAGIYCATREVAVKGAAKGRG
ncbi:hypothetical protein [Streptomyces sp. NPDC051561]|uniref:hypothetical protein n=1 Tax=Streptomyces sp. NPDC051561 TaxID=3365658 RepID=UPI0037A8F4FC